MSPPAPAAPARAARFASVTIGIALVLALSQYLFAVQLHRPVWFRVAALAVAALMAGATRLRPALRVNVALTVAPAILALYGFEGRVASRRPYDGTMAYARGVDYDARSPWEVIRDARAAGEDAYPPFQPRGLLVLDLNKGLSPDEAQNHVISREWGLVIDGARTLPLGGVSNKHIIHCNEGGRYSEWESDEHGFNNPKGLWGRDRIDVVLLGDSFVQAACVGQDENAAHWIRQRYPGTVNLGVAGNGPLLELAGLVELAAPRKPEVVLWFYFNNDMADLDVEKLSPLLLRYLEEDGFSQRLGERQARIDAALVELAARIEARARRWPSSLASVGLTRRSAPLWLGDLVMGETHSSASAVIRLDRLSLAAMEATGAKYFRRPPDLPLFKRILAKAKSLVEGWHGKLYFVYMADVHHLQYRGKTVHHNREGVLRAAKEVGLPIIDTQPAFLAVEDLSTIRFHPDSHCNPEGYRLVAEVVLRALEEGSK